MERGARHRFMIDFHARNTPPVERCGGVEIPDRNFPEHARKESAVVGGAIDNASRHGAVGRKKALQRMRYGKRTLQQQ